MNPQGTWKFFTRSKTFAKLLILYLPQIKVRPAMGSRDYRHRETKKPKKAAKKQSPNIIIPPATVEVIKKGKKSPPPEE